MSSCSATASCASIRGGGVFKLFRAGGRRVGIAGELLHFLWERKLWWLMPLVAVLLAVGLLLILAQSSAIGPLIYTLF